MKEGVGIIERIVKWIEKNKIFVRERKSNVERALGMLLYHAGLSYNKTGVDIEDEKVVAVFVSYGRSYFEVMAFLKRVRKACKGKLPRVFIDGGKWYPWALQRLGFNRYTVVKFGPRSAIERFFGNLEWRIRRFWNAYNGKYSIESMQKWVESFAGFRNFYKDLEVLS